MECRVGGILGKGTTFTNALSEDEDIPIFPKILGIVSQSHPCFKISGLLVESRDWGWVGPCRIQDEVATVVLAGSWFRMGLKERECGLLGTYLGVRTNGPWG